MSWWNNWYVSFLSWRVRHIKERNFIVILSLLVGIITGLAGVFLKNSVHYTHQFLTERLQIDSGSLLFFILPFIGIWLTSLFVRYFVREDISHGVTKVLYAISRRNSMIKPHNNYSSMIAQYDYDWLWRIGGNGSDDCTDRCFHRFEYGPFFPHELQGDDLDDRVWGSRGYRRNFQSSDCRYRIYPGGTDAGPDDGFLGAFDDCCHFILRYCIFSDGEGVVLEFAVHEHFALANVPYYIILGILCGLVSVYFIRTNIRIEKFITGIKNQFKRILVGGALLGLLFIFFRLSTVKDTLLWKLC